MGIPQTLNLYSYVQNNPITGIDPDGHCLTAFGNCPQYILGGLMAIANIPSETGTLLNRTINTLTGSNIPDAPTFQPSNEDQRQGMQAANAMMMISPLVEIAAPVEAAGAAGLGATNDIRRIAQEGAEREANGLARAESEYGIKLERKPDGTPVKQAPHNTETGAAIRDENGKTSIFDGVGKNKSGDRVGVEVSKEKQSASEAARKADQAKRQDSLIKDPKSDIKVRIEIKLP